MVYELIAICDACKQAAADGSLWVDMAEVDRCSNNHTRAWEILETPPCQNVTSRAK
ncbi:hypothetical protein ABZ137_33945 [Streptomyces bobili]|uniref:hypothetical protein n=1 Tax=Streptomyces bobili TaxID=67280 RepID=UPI0033A3FAD8